jgi:hypothetical protein
MVYDKHGRIIKKYFRKIKKNKIRNERGWERKKSPQLYQVGPELERNRTKKLDTE